MECDVEGEQEYRSPDVDGDRRVERRSLLQGLESHVIRFVLAGFLVLIPLIITVVVVRIFFNYLDDFVQPWLGDRVWFLDFPGVGVVAILLLLYVIGALVSWEAGRIAVNWQGAILSRIPVVKSIYGVAKQATDALSSPLGHHFSRVVFVEWPRPGVMALGLVTGHISSPEGENLVAVYIPTVPNPTSGMLAFISEDEVTDTNISVEDAMKMVFSGGIVLPRIGVPALLSQPRKN